MTVQRQFACNLCRASVMAETAIGIRWKCMNEIEPVYLNDAENHLCNECVKGLRVMLAALDRIGEIHDELDRAGTE